MTPCRWCSEPITCRWCSEPITLAIFSAGWIHDATGEAYCNQNAGDAKATPPSYSSTGSTR